MQSPLWPQMRDVLLIGGGHAHALVLRKWGMAPQAGSRITVINPGPVAPYTGMLPGHIAGHYSRDSMMIDLIRLARFAGARVVMGRAVGIDRGTKQAILADGRRLRYDVASIDIGIASTLPDLPGFEDHALAAKPLGGYAEGWEAFLAHAPEAPRLVIIGAGVGGAELAMASAHRLAQTGRKAEITLLERQDEALPNVGEGARRALLAALARHGVVVKTGAMPVAVAKGSVTLADGQVLPSDFTLSVAGAQPQPWLADTGLALHKGFVTISPTLQSSDPSIFAVGDCAHMGFAPRPKAGVFAVRQAPILYHNLRASLSGVPLRRYHPQRDYLKLISMGEQRAVADKLGLRLEGAWLWRWKDRIDRKFMAKFEDYPAMKRPALPKGAVAGLAEVVGEKPLCGGCGAKVGGDTLRGALARLPAPRRADVLSGPGDDAGILSVGKGMQVLTTDHLRAFSNDAALMARIAAIHALGDIWAMGATPQSALSQITLPRLGPTLQADMLAEILAASAEVFTAAGADVLGGHSTIGAELSIGFSLTGLATQPILKTTARAGDAIILTKPIGTGTILAAEMAMTNAKGMLLGEAVAACYASMQRPLGVASRRLAPHATAMTDVTGFGLAAHLLEMLEGAGLSADVQLDQIPFLEGAETLAALGVASSGAPANRAACLGRIAAPVSARTDLLFDPQTAGGLLATVPTDRAEEVLAALQDAGEPAAIIGHVASGPVMLRVTG
ncbi:selenide, water dikinase SelD (plasmid) [Pseudorhodobacter turbinis]|uniref:Selenide, water dikinase SelD n=1 Tax=Pseudorhodobacter turbinis TaxID=2500533 RepID=A0A4V1E1A7_9RHOB|nr:selenide, water dikinase SelD [Pseudorhodobacter turbinis]QCO57474.1 selenide, water dikinase SelD [Pseudorhodobacter turbinis]